MPFQNHYILRQTDHLPQGEVSSHQEFEVIKLVLPFPAACNSIFKNREQLTYLQTEQTETV